MGKNLGFGDFLHIIIISISLFLLFGKNSCICTHVIYTIFLEGVTFLLSDEIR
jgi:hypothetical protein